MKRKKDKRKMGKKKLKGKINAIKATCEREE
jgi:hypothetical protein